MGETQIQVGCAPRPHAAMEAEVIKPEEEAKPVENFSILPGDSC